MKWWGWVGLGLLLVTMSERKWLRQGADTPLTCWWVEFYLVCWMLWWAAWQR